MLASLLIVIVYVFTNPDSLVTIILTSFLPTTIVFLPIPDIEAFSDAVAKTSTLLVPTGTFTS